MSGVTCDLFTFRFPQTCADTFKECCNERASMIATDPPATTPTANREYDVMQLMRFDILVQSCDTFPSGEEGLCERFPEQLCGDICIDVPGSYRCECREGFALQSDGRSCSPESRSLHPLTLSPLSLKCMCIVGVFSRRQMSPQQPVRTHL